MSTTQPIRDSQDVKSFVDYYNSKKPNLRNHALIVFGLHTALRISDILSLDMEVVQKMQHFIQNVAFFCFSAHLLI